VLAPLSGELNVWVWEQDNPDRQRVALTDPGAMPLQADDLVRVEARLNRPAFVYLVWIDTDGVPKPIYPWMPGKWTEFAELERPLTHVSLPQRADGFWSVQKGRPGMETLLLLGRETQLPPDVDLRELLTGLPISAIKNPRSLVWFDDWALVQGAGARERGPSFFEVDVKDPILQTQALLKERLKPHFSVMRAVSFANRGG
jgi:hypothetical protein